MSLKFIHSSYFCLLFLAMGHAHLWAQEHNSTASDVVPVNVEQFPTAETHHMMKVSIDNFDCLGKWSHVPGFTPIDKQNVV